MEERKQNFSMRMEGLDSLFNEVKQLLNLEELAELASKIEEKAESGDLKTEVHFSARSNIPRQGNIPRSDRFSRSTRVSTTNDGDEVETSYTTNFSHSPQTGSSRDHSSRNTVRNSVRTTSTAHSAHSSASSSAHASTNQEQSKTSANHANDSKQTNQSQPPLDRTVGGLGKVLAQLRDLVEVPLKRPDILEKLGLEPPKGVLMVGPPGTGKTLTARSLADHLGVNYIAIVAPEIVGKYYGEAEKKLRQVFEKATKAAPCLIFIDEIDALVPNRTQVEGEVEKRIVAQMLGLMDGFASRSGVIVLAATNRPDAIDPALRRPGRFDREIHFPVPDRNDRREILAIHTANMPLAADVNLELLADQCLGFVGADIKGLCQTAAYGALQRQVVNLAQIPDRLVVNNQDFTDALKQIQPAVLRSLTVQAPQVQWSEIGGLETIKNTLQEAVAGALNDRELYDHAKAQAPRGILLSGPPGTGKTLLAKAIATAAQANFIAINGPELLTKWVGASEQALRQIFAQARQVAPCVIFIDEIDTLAPARGNYQGDSGVSDRMIGQLLTELDGLQSSDGILLIAATNRKSSLDPALLRSGRIELHLTVDLPAESDRLAILAVHNRDRPLAEDVNLDQWAGRTDGYNGADLAFLSNRAAIFAIRRHQQTRASDRQIALSDLKITSSDFEQALAELDQQRH
ncbi:AAA family ATPase [Thalassoporum mexicanum]|uniref:AAA family ATPase n=1 Tax=Thalassoporum mexicanum TaxID=3457544 RepID=UPI001CEC17CB|nr:AAA family ATPase [Pseudanabaena sp. PCC 7367]